MRRENVVNLASRIIRSVAPEAVVTLYGSQARGDASADSDVDLLILLPGERDAGFIQKQRELTEALLFDVELKTGVQISPYVVTKSWWDAHPETPFTINIKNEGIAV